MLQSTSLAIAKTATAVPLLCATQCIKPTAKATLQFSTKLIPRAAAVGIICHGIGIFTCAEAAKGFASGVVAVLFCIEPIASAVLAHFTLPNSRLSRLNCTGMVIAIIGIIMVVYPNLNNNSGIGSPTTSINMKIWYGIAGITSPILYGCGAVLNKKIMDDELAPPVLILIAFENFTGFCYLIIQSLIVNAINNVPVFQDISNAFDSSYRAWILVLSMAITSAVIAWGMFMWLLKRIGTKASLYAFIVPCIALFLGAILNHEWDEVSFGMIILQIIGVVVVLFGMSLVLFEEKVKKFLERFNNLNQ
jgi:drug/metabolite transporter (DMT)-like permease